MILPFPPQTRETPSERRERETREDEAWEQRCRMRDKWLEQKEDENSY
jgi:hypothetical protein